MFELIKDKNGEKVVDTVVTNILLDLKKDIEECKQEFEDL
jgi:hypothetical protein